MSKDLTTEKTWRKSLMIQVRSWAVGVYHCGTLARATILPTLSAPVLRFAIERLKRHAIPIYDSNGIHAHDDMSFHDTSAILPGFHCGLRTKHEPKPTFTCHHRAARNHVDQSVDNAAGRGTSRTESRIDNTCIDCLTYTTG